MAFDLYFAGGVGKECTETLRKLNCCQLLSQLNERKAINEWVEYLRSHPECTCKLFIDSGAFSAHTKGKEVDLEDYIQFINSIDDCVYIFAQLDKIPGRFGRPKTEEELAEAPRLSWENYLYMAKRVKSRDKLLPIFHQGEDFKWLRNMLEYTHEDGSHIKYIGVSSTNDLPTSEKIKWFNEVFKTIKSSSNPNVMTHAFGMTIEKVLEQFPFTSADSTGWIMTGANGGIRIDGKIVIMSSLSTNKAAHIDQRNVAVQDAVQKKIDEFGFTLEELKEDYSKRQLFNIHSLKQWADNYKYIGNDLYKAELF